MTDVGAVGFLGPGLWPAKRVANWLSPPPGLITAGPANQVLLSATGEGTISGTVQEGGAAKANVWVYLLYRGHEADMGDIPAYIVERKRSASDGTFSFSGLNTSDNCYSVMALDPDGGTQYNIAIHDRITPV